MIAINKLSKSYSDGTVSLSELTLQVPPGKLYALLGANGAGKSTTLHILLGLIKATGGSASIAGVDVAREPERARAHLGYIPEQVALYDELTAAENVRFLLELAGYRRSLAACEQYLVDLGFPETALRRPARLLSKGMRQKAVIAALRQRKPAALLLDEPTSGLDPQATAEFLDDLAALRNQGCALLMATHDLLRVRTLADEVGILNRGRLVASRAGEELRSVDLEMLYLESMNQTP